MKKVLALVLAIVLCLPVMAVPVFAAGITYRNDKLGFEVTLPASWEGRYGVDESESNTVSFYDLEAKEALNTSYNINIVSIYRIAKSDYVDQSDIDGFQGVLWQDGNYVFCAYTPDDAPFSSPDDKAAVGYAQMCGDIPTILSSFKKIDAAAPASPTPAPVISGGIDYNKLYSPSLNDPSAPFNSQYAGGSQYGLYDLNNDGVLELIVINNGGRATQGVYVYTIRNNAAAYLGWWQSAGFIYICPDGGLIISDQYQGLSYVGRLQVINDKIVTASLVGVVGDGGPNLGKVYYGDEQNGLSSDDAKALLKKWFPDVDPKDYVDAGNYMMNVNAFKGPKDLPVVPVSDNSLLLAANKSNTSPAPAAVTSDIANTFTNNTGSAAAPAPSAIAVPTASKVLINGKQIAFDAYNINGNNYFKLRDLAYVLSGTAKQFDVGWDGANNAISLTSGKPYTVGGGEMTGKGAGNKTATPTNSKIYLDGKEVSFTAYNIDGNNYFKLRDIGQAFDFGIGWDGATSTITIDTSQHYEQ